MWAVNKIIRVEIAGNGTYAPISCMCGFCLVNSVAQSYQQRHAQKLNPRYKYTNKVFSGWDFSIDNDETAKLKCISIRRDLQVTYGSFARE